jgi:hypothetical protein
MNQIKKVIIVGDSTAQSYFRGVKQGANQEYDLQLIRSPADNPNINTFTVSLLFILLYSFITPFFFLSKLKKNNISSSH